IHGDGDKRALIKETLAKKFIKESEVDIEEIYNYLNGQRFLSEGGAGFDYSRTKMSEFFMTFSLLAGTHHSQDPSLFSRFIKYPVQVYLDIDFLTLVFGSKYNFLYEGEKGESKSGYMKRVKGAELYCHFVDTFSPELAAVPFSKRGYYSAREYVGDSMLVLLLKRAKRYWFNRTKGPVNFTLGRWMADYVNKEFTNIDTHADVAKLFDIEKVKNSLSTNVHQSKEQYWRKYTDIIWMHRLIKK
ncbi:MAG: hypothetical protein GY757_19415, partial [bacterium]|nr:hypothetical protein [bacterium]